MYPTGTGSPKFYGLPKIHKPGIPLRPIVSSRGTVTYNTGKELAKILKPMVEMSSLHVLNTRDFVQQLKGTRLQQDECNISCDVKALFTSVPIQPLINIIHNKLVNDKDLHQRTSMAIHHIINLLRHLPKEHLSCISREILWANRGSSNGVTIKSYSGEHLYGRIWRKNPQDSTTPPSLWKRFVDDTFDVIKLSPKEEFFTHINSIEERIQFTAENTRADGFMPFLDTLVTLQADGSFPTTVYRMPTHTNQYLQWNNHHAISAKYSVISTLFHRAKEVCSTKQQLDEEHEHLQNVLTTCKYPRWALHRMKRKTCAPVQSKSNNHKEKNGTDNKSKSNNRRNYITVPCTKGLSESFKNICKKHGIQVYLREGQDHQRPHGGTQRQRPHNQKEWHHI